MYGIPFPRAERNLSFDRPHPARFILGWRLAHGSTHGARRKRRRRKNPLVPPNRRPPDPPEEMGGVHRPGGNPLPPRRRFGGGRSPISPPPPSPRGRALPLGRRAGGPKRPLPAGRDPPRPLRRAERPAPAALLRIGRDGRPVPHLRGNPEEPLGVRAPPPDRTALAPDAPGLPPSQPEFAFKNPNGGLPV